MKKLLATLALAGATTVAIAQNSQIALDVQNQNFANGSQDQQQIAVNVKTKINNLIAVDGQVQTAQNENGASNAYKVVSRYEAGITAQQAITGAFDVYGRLAVGEKAASGSDRFGYHSQEVGVIYHTPIQGLHAKVGYRWRDSFEANKGDTAESIRYALTYDLNKTNSIVYRRDINHSNASNGGDSTVNAIQYVYKF